MSDKEPLPAFIDTNIWLYAFIESGLSEKSLRARELLATCESVVSVQIVNEVCVNLIKKAGFSEQQIRQLIDAFYEKFVVAELDQDTLTTASELRQRYKFSFWDSMVIASALQMQIPILYSEDLQHQQIIDNRLQVLNPFIA